MYVHARPISPGFVQQIMPNARVIVTLQLTVGRSVSQSVRLGVEPLRNSWPDFGFGQNSCFFVCLGAFPLSRQQLFHLNSI
jgi:hypothetical protein